MQEKANNYFATLPEPDQSCLLFLRRIILQHSEFITESWSFNTPFYRYKSRSLCFISYDKKTSTIYVSMTHGNKIQHRKLLSEGRKKMKIFYVDATQDIDIKSLNQILKKACAL